MTSEQRDAVDGMMRGSPLGASVSHAHAGGTRR